MTNLKTTLIPVGHHLVVEPITLPEKSKGGIIISHEGTTWDKLQKASRMLGTILAVGPQCWKAHSASLLDYVEERDPALDPWAKVGDLIFYSRHAGKFMFDPIERKVGTTHTDELGVEYDGNIESEFGPLRQTQSEYKATLKELYVINDDDVIAVLPPLSTWTVDALDVMTF